MNDPSKVFVAEWCRHRLGGRAIANHRCKLKKNKEQVRITLNLPTQSVPFPLDPNAHVQLKEGTRFIQIPNSWWQLWVFSLHSLISITKTKKTLDKVIYKHLNFWNILIMTHKVRNLAREWMKERRKRRGGGGKGGKLNRRNIPTMYKSFIQVLTVC